MGSRSLRILLEVKKQDGRAAIRWFYFRVAAFFLIKIGWYRKEIVHEERKFCHLADRIDIPVLLKLFNRRYAG